MDFVPLSHALLWVMGPFPRSMFNGPRMDVMDEIKRTRYLSIIITQVIAEESPDPVCISTPDILTEARSDDIIEMKIHAEASHEEYLVTSGDGKGKQLRGNFLGMYQSNPEHCYYMQVSTEEHPDKTKRKIRYQVNQRFICQDPIWTSK